MSSQASLPLSSEGSEGASAPSPLRSIWLENRLKKLRERGELVVSGKDCCYRIRYVKPFTHIDSDISGDWEPLDLNCWDGADGFHLAEAALLAIYAGRPLNRIRCGHIFSSDHKGNPRKYDN